MSLLWGVLIIEIIVYTSVFILSGSEQKFVSITQLILETIDSRSFSNLWFWIGLIVVWSRLSYWPMGVPVDMILRAKKHKAEAEQDLMAILRIQCQRIVDFSQKFGMLSVALLFFTYSMLIILGFVYGVEFAQALFLLSFPVLMVFLLNARFAHKALSEEMSLAQLYVKLERLRFHVQLIGFASITIVVLWGMYWNLRMLF